MEAYYTLMTWNITHMLCWSFCTFFFIPLAQRLLIFLGDSKDSTNGETAGGAVKRSSATRMVTRLRNPESKLSQLKSQQVAAAVHEANRGFKEGKEVRC